MRVSSAVRHRSDAWLGTVRSFVRTARQVVPRAARGAVGRVCPGRAVRVSEIQLRAVLQTLSEGVLVQDERGRVIQANPAASRILEIPPDALVTDPPSPLRYEAIDPAGLDLPVGARPGRQALDTEQSHTGMIIGVQRTDRIQWLEVNVTPVTLSDGRKVVTSSFWDVTERRRVEEEMRRLSAIVESSVDAIYGLSLDGTIASWNRSAERLFGYGAGEVIGRSAALLVPPGEQHDLDVIVAEVSRRGMVVDRETRCRRRDGTIVEVAVTISTMFSAYGEVAGYSVVARDLTETLRLRAAAEAQRRRRERAEREAERRRTHQQAAEQASRAKSEFLSRMSHELRTPLNSVLGFTQLLSLDELSDDQSRLVDQVHRAGRHLLDLVDDVLDVGRIETDDLRMELGQVPVGAMVTEVIAGVASAATHKGVVVSESEAIDASLEWHADASRVRQILENLVTNAVDYHPGGGTVVVAARCKGPMVRLSVADDGVGIAPSDQERLFAPFERLGAERTPVTGTGMGLPLARGLAEQMGGRLGVDSVVGEGSTFWFELPSVAPSP